MDLRLCLYIYFLLYEITISTLYRDTEKVQYVFVACISTCFINKGLKVKGF